MFVRTSLLCSVWLGLLLGGGLLTETAVAERPNVVVILADDLGIGDIGVYNADSKIKTPHIDRLATQGLQCLDAHAPGSWCIPTRYGLLTGRYPHTAKYKPGTLFDPKTKQRDPVVTLPQFLSGQGYHTAFVGKWHLGVGFEAEGKPAMNAGPHRVGFQYSFGIPASLDIPPYYYYENGAATKLPTDTIGDSNTEGWTRIQGAFWRGGGIAPDFKHAEVLPKITAKACEYVRSRKDASDPYFLYFALTAPHTPWLPSEEFENSGGAGMYGDFVRHVDASVGDLLKAIDESGHRDNTLVIFTSDNGPVWYETDREQYGHAATGPYRGMKADLWEGGHRMPMLIRWPKEIAAGLETNALVSQVDLFATLAGIIEVPVPEGVAVDSIDQTGIVAGGDPRARTELVVVRNPGTLLIRSGDWTYLPIRNGGGFSRWRAGKGDPKTQLYNLKTDPGQRTNVVQDHPDIAERLHKRFEQELQRQ